MNNQYKHFMNYGGVAAFVSFALFLLIYFLGMNPLGNYSWLGAWVIIVLIYKGIKDFRDQLSEGFISYGKALSVGMMLVFFYSLLYGLLTFISSSLLFPEIVEVHKTEVMTGMEKLRTMLSEEQFESMYDKMEKALEEFTLSNIIIGDFWNKIIGGLIISLIVAGILKKSKPLFEETDEVQVS